jgi:type III polyketide synthase
VINYGGRLKKLLQINRRTGIESRACVRTYEHGFGAQSDPPGIIELDIFFRTVGVDLAVQACKKALREWGGRRDEITHTIGVTCTNQGNPGYDLLVRRKLGLSFEVDRMLLHGVGCAGGLAIMRAAAQIASGATARGRPARILAFACELCSPNVRCELAAAEKSTSRDVGIGGAIFSDGAAAFVLCNSLGLGEATKPVFELLEWGTGTLPGTEHHMSFVTDPFGERASRRTAKSSH